MTRRMGDGQVEVSVVRDGAYSWLCRVEWPDGRTRYRELTFFAAGLPDVVITSEELAVECLAAAVKANPREWEPEETAQPRGEKP